MDCLKKSGFGEIFKLKVSGKKMDISVFDFIGDTNITQTAAR